jgi:hypothetical protein
VTEKSERVVLWIAGSIAALMLVGLLVVGAFIAFAFVYTLFHLRR